MCPPGDQLHTDEENKILRELCVKVFIQFVAFVGILLLIA